ncbi:hypothetical protein RFI_10698 [Reticulomyxa filosa]|uniref:Uncharacterized protein n=1 Tax=Reticulomyxa filosa TaxID=46433 RepID=X6NKE4_RETFI|nr:hypothetical protein RFI_10698 [Reticulomyxa filosa]|eukprot:ETO26441.1 hypothetical protein RFI_10698 [Reticulomyxa filosa]
MGNIHSQELTKEQMHAKLIQTVRRHIERGEYEDFQEALKQLGDPSNKLFPFVASLQRKRKKGLNFVNVKAKALFDWNKRDIYVQIIHLLLQQGADFDLSDEFGHKCTDDIGLLPEITEIFVQYGYRGRFIACLPTTKTAANALAVNIMPTTVQLVTSHEQ